MRPSQTSLEFDALQDMLSDARQSDKQAVNGPFYPERGITAESLAAYAAECFAKASRFANGGAHKAALAP
jgi:hypothetical protein